MMIVLLRGRGHRRASCAWSSSTAFQHLVTAQTYNALFTLHGVIMIFLFVIPGLPAVFGNFFLPILIGAKDVAFPRLNLASWYFFMAGRHPGRDRRSSPAAAPPDTGWTFYAPFSLKTGTNVTLAVFAAFVLGFSSMLTGINFITTIHRLRAPGMTWFRMPLFCWALYATAWIQILATPILAITLVLVILERLFGIGIFDPSKGGDPAALPAPLLDLLAPGGLHHDPARHGRHHRDPAHLRQAHHLRLQGHRLLLACPSPAWAPSCGPTTCSPAA